jgi:hypothetical protein
MVRAIIVFFVSFVALSACTQRLICPAYQSAFIYDKEALRKKFSYFKEDSTPKVLTASKSKYLIATSVSYQKKIRSLRTVEMKPVFPIVPDSLRDDYVDDVSLAELDKAARSVIDSTFIVDVERPQADSTQNSEDSVYVITKDKELRLLKYDADSMKYSVVDVRLNVDQDNYMWYLRDFLVLPDVKIAKMQGAGGKEAAAKKEKKGFFGFFKNLFKKKKKETPDTTTVIPVRDENDFDYIDTLQQAKPVIQQRAPKKKGLFSSLKKNKTPKADKKADATREDEEPAITEEKPAKKRKEKKKKEDTTEPAEPDNKEDKSDGF